MTFRALQLALELVRMIRQLIEKLMTKDPSLADQLRRAAASVPLNLAEGARRTGRDQAHSYRIAGGSAAEVMTALQIAEAWGQLTLDEITAAVGVCDRILAMVYRLTHR